MSAPVSPIAAATAAVKAMAATGATLIRLLYAAIRSAQHRQITVSLNAAGSARRRPILLHGPLLRARQVISGAQQLPEAARNRGEPRQQAADRHPPQGQPRQRVVSVRRPGNRYSDLQTVGSQTPRLAVRNLRPGPPTDKGNVNNRPEANDKLSTSGSLYLQAETGAPRSAKGLGESYDSFDSSGSFFCPLSCLSLESSQAI